MPEYIKKLVGKLDLVKLKELSQQCVENAFYKVRFGVHSVQGVHGACPIEMLHAMLLLSRTAVKSPFYYFLYTKLMYCFYTNPTLASP